MNSSCLLIFTKIPGATRCKTRLQQSTPLNREETVLLAKAFLADTLLNAQSVSVGRIVLAIEPLCSAGELEKSLSELPFPPNLEDESRLSIIEQRGGNFAARLSNALDDAYSLQQTKNLVVIGTDSPSLSKTTINCALDSSEKGAYVLGPSLQGGFYLIGFPSEQSSKALQIEGAFSHEQKSELEFLAEQINWTNYPLVLLETHFDIDVAEDLSSLIPLLHAASVSEATRIAEAKNTRRVLSELGLALSNDHTNNRKVSIVKNVS